MKFNHFPGCLTTTLVLLGLQLNAQLAAGHSKFLGNIGGGNISSDYMTLWNQITPENGGKWGSVEGTKDVMSWGTMDVVYNFAKNSGIPVRFHTLVWGQQQPSWISALPADQQLAQVEQWFKLTAARYPALDMIDVVNEPLPGHAPAGYKNALGGDGPSGWDWVIKSFEMARQYFPNAKLHLNDYHILSSPANVQTYSKIINLLKTKGLIDGIGCQGHFLETTSAATVLSNLNTLATLGLPIYITEFDLHLADDTQQLNKYKELFPVIWEHTAVKGVTLWGYRQGSIWRTDAYLIRSDGTDRPALTWLKEYFNPTASFSVNYPQITIYPNPACRSLYIKGAKEHLLKIYLSSGQLVFEDKISSLVAEIDVSSFPKGILFCELSIGNFRQTTRIIHQLK